ncbi:MAG TPA: hypothetical protein VGC41_12295 [Kofleriaceae bacterium]
MKKTPAKRVARKGKAKGKVVVAKRKPIAKGKPRKKPASRSTWVKLVEKHGVLLAAARGPVLNVADLVVGEPIVGGWWAHPKGKEIFEALSQIDDSDDIRSFRLIDGKVTFAHRRVWPAIVRLGRDGVFDLERLGSVQQIHTRTGEHRTTIVPFPDWVDERTAIAADALGDDQARALLPSCELW